MSERRPYIPGPSAEARNARVYCEATGFYAVRLAKGAVEVGMQIRHEPTRDPETGELLDRSYYWSVLVGGKLQGEPTIEPPTRLWIGRPITKAEHDFLIDDRKWAQQYSIDLPEATPTRAIDPRKAPPSW